MVLNGYLLELKRLAEKVLDPADRRHRGSEHPVGGEHGEPGVVEACTEHQHDVGGLKVAGRRASGLLGAGAPVGESGLVAVVSVCNEQRCALHYLCDLAENRAVRGGPEALAESGVVEKIDSRLVGVH